MILIYTAKPSCIAYSYLCFLQLDGYKAFYIQIVTVVQKFKNQNLISHIHWKSLTLSKLVQVLSISSVVTST